MSCKKNIIICNDKHQGENQFLGQNYLEVLSGVTCCLYLKDSRYTRKHLKSFGRVQIANTFLYDDQAKTITQAQGMNTTTDHKLTFEERSLKNIEEETEFRRDINLWGIHFQVGILFYRPYITLPKGKTSLADSEGFGIDVLNLLKTKLNFTYTFHRVNTFGSLLENGTWNGMVGALQRKEFDFGASPIRLVVIIW